MDLRLPICVTLLGAMLHAVPNELPRRAYLGVRLRFSRLVGDGAEVARIDSAEVADKLGLKTGDLILQINHIPVSTEPALERFMRTLHAGDKAQLDILREGQVIKLTGILGPLPKERLPGVEVIYDSVSTEAGYRLRAIISRPQNKAGKLPVVFLVGWLSCDSVEYPLGPDDGFGQLLHDVATRSGMVLFRVDKPGTGDSEGPACGDLDLKTELSACVRRSSTLRFHRRESDLCTWDEQWGRLCSACCARHETEGFHRNRGVGENVV